MKPYSYYLDLHSAVQKSVCVKRYCVVTADLSKLLHKPKFSSSEKFNEWIETTNHLFTLHSIDDPDIVASGLMIMSRDFYLDNTDKRRQDTEHDHIRNIMKTDLYDHVGISGSLIAEDIAYGARIIYLKYIDALTLVNMTSDQRYKIFIDQIIKIVDYLGGREVVMSTNDSDDVIRFQKQIINMVKETKRQYILVQKG